jgi:GTP-binding protein
LARTSSLPGRTQEINLYLINNSLYLLDLPGYGFVKSSPQAQEYLSRLVNWYLFTSGYEQRLVVLIIDAEVGPTASDLEILQSLEKYRKNIVIVCNKVDKIKKTNYKKQMEKIKDKLSSHVIIPYSTKNKIGVGGLLYEIFLD